MWGEWAQNQNKAQTTIVDSEKEFNELLKCPGTGVTNLIFLKDDVAWVSRKYSEDNISVGKRVNMAIAAYVTTQARLKLYEDLSKLWEYIFYRDTDSTISIQKDNDPQKSKQGIIWETSQMSWRSTFDNGETRPTSRNYNRSLLRNITIIYFRLLLPDKNNS